MKNTEPMTFLEMIDYGFDLKTSYSWCYARRKTDTSMKLEPSALVGSWPCKW